MPMEAEEEVKAKEQVVFMEEEFVMKGEEEFVMKGEEE